MKYRFLFLFFLFIFFAEVGLACAASFIIVDNETGCILAEKGRDQKNATASLAQIALAMTVLDWATISKTNLDALVTIPANPPDQGTYNPLGLRQGDRLTLRDLLYLSVMISDHEAAQRIASFVGSHLPNPQQLDAVGNFVSQMNALARKLQMTRTLFLNPSGRDQLPSEAQPYSTAADLARLVRYAYSKPGLLFYTSQRSRNIQIERDGKKFQVMIQNTNTLLGVDRIDGVKIGHTNRANGCLALTSEDRPEVRREGSTVYTAPRRIDLILLNSSDPLEEGMGLIRQGWQLYQAWAKQGRPTKGYRFL
ncbi:MAG: serine hydrolase [Chthoniobacterales bacterium]|nr:serine hydrolase [Chthoniobacterales bacterium]